MGIDEHAADGEVRAPAAERAGLGGDADHDFVMDAGVPAVGLEDWRRRSSIKE